MQKNMTDRTPGSYDDFVAYLGTVRTEEELFSRLTYWFAGQDRPEDVLSRSELVEARAKELGFWQGLTFRMERWLADGKSELEAVGREEFQSRIAEDYAAYREKADAARARFRDRRRAAPLVAALVRVTQQFADACFAAKCEEKLLDYADFEHLTLDLLLTPDNQRTPLCRTVSSHYSAVLVDEYQDTNALQDAIYFALARSEGDNLFFVGDIKQSIYRFRQADPQVFVDKQQRWQAYPQPAPQPASLALDANFRSAPGVIAGINYLFEVFFSQGLGGVAYGDGQRLVVGSKTTD